MCIQGFGKTTQRDDLITGAQVGCHPKSQNLPELRSQSELDIATYQAMMPSKLGKCIKWFRWAGFFLMISFTAAAHATEFCMPSDELEAALIDWYGEHPVEESSDNIVLWASQGGETWTVVQYNADGTACTLGQGSNWSGAPAV